MTDVAIRPEHRDDDAEPIHRIIDVAFASAPRSGGNEAAIVRALRAADALSVSLVAERLGEVVGHVAVSPIRISDGTRGWFGLGPIAVAPQHQKQGIGHQLMTRALFDLQQRNAQGCVLLGEPRYYGRFGFQQIPELVLPGVPPEYFLALPFGKTTPKGSVMYHEAFSVS